MKFKFSTLLFFFWMLVDAQNIFQKKITEGMEYQKLSISSFDNTYVIAWSRWHEGSFYDFCVVKMDENGNTLWSKKYLSPGDEYLSALSISSSGDILLSGHKSNTAGNNDLSLLKLNPSGEVKWYKSYGTIKSELSTSMSESPLGNVFLFGNREMSQRPIVLKTDKSGALLWSKTYGTLASEEQDLGGLGTKEGGVVLYGELPKSAKFLMKIDVNGITSWTNSYTSSHNQLLSSIKQTKDGGFILASSDYRCDQTGCHSYFSFIKLDMGGNVSWAKAVDSYLGAGKNAIETSDGGFVFTGQLRDSMYTKAVLIKTNNKGEMLWTKLYGMKESFGEGYFVEETPNNGLILFGTEESKAYLIKTDANGNSGCNEKNLMPTFSNIDFVKSNSVTFFDTIGVDSTSILTYMDSALALKDTFLCTTVGVNEIYFTDARLVYPNPFNESVAVEIINNKIAGENTEFTMYDIFGRKVLQLPISGQQIQISRGNLPDGMYFYTIYTGKKIISKGRLIAQ
jgi:hypothetical protein